VRFSFLDQTISSDLIWPTRSHPKRVIALDYGHGTCLSRLRTARGKKSHMLNWEVITNEIRVRRGLTIRASSVSLKSVGRRKDVLMSKMHDWLQSGMGNECLRGRHAAKRVKWQKNGHLASEWTASEWTSKSFPLEGENQERERIDRRLPDVLWCLWRRRYVKTARKVS